MISAAGRIRPLRVPFRSGRTSRRIVTIRSPEQKEHTMLSTLFSIVMGLSAGVTLAEAPAKPAPPPVHRIPGCAEPERHQLDFWLGDWDTFEPEGAPGESQ